MRLRTIAVTAAAATLAARSRSEYLAYRREMADAWTRVRTEGRLITTAAGVIEVAQRGKGAPVLAVHGAVGGFDQGCALAAPLVERGMRVVAPSRFGYLGTPLPADASPAAQADAHAALLDALGIERCVAIGVSAGATSCIEFAVRHPKRCAGLVLLVPLAFAPREPDRETVRLRPAARLVLNTGLYSDFVFWFAVTHALDAVASRMLATPAEILARANDAERARIQAFLKLMLPMRPRAAGTRNDARIALNLEPTNLRAVTCPTLVVSGRDDGFGMERGARYTAQHIKGAQHLIYERGGHILAGHRSEVLGEVESFLAAYAR